MPARRNACHGEAGRRRTRDGDLGKAGVMAGYHTRWVRPPEQAEDPEQIAIREALAFAAGPCMTSAAPSLSASSSRPGGLR